MFAWLRDTFANTSSPPSYSHSMIPSDFFRRQQKQQQQQPREHPRAYCHKQECPRTNAKFSRSDDEETDDESNDNSFYHNPYHSSGLMNYTDVPQQQYINEHTYPTYLAQQQSSEHLRNQSIDEQIHQKLLLLQQRGSQFQTHSQGHDDFSYEISSNSNENQEKTSGIDEQVGQEEETTEQILEKPVSINDGADDDYGIKAFYPGEYPHCGEPFDLASVALWYRNMMRSVKKFM